MSQQSQTEGASQTLEGESLLDEILSEAKMGPGNEGYEIAKAGVQAFIAELIQPKREGERVDKALVDAMIAIDGARSHLYNAASAIDHDPGAALRAAHMAKAAASDAARFGASRAVQFHGGIGFTWECHVQLYFKRQLHNEALYGDAAWHRGRPTVALSNGAAGRRHHCDDAAGGRPLRRPEGHGDVPKGERPAARHRRKYEFVRLRPLR